MEKKKKNPHRHVILLDSIKYPNNFVIKSPITCLNPKKKKKHLNPHVCVLYDTYDSYNTHLCIRYFTSTYDTSLIQNFLYMIWCILYDTYHVSYDTNNYATNYKHKYCILNRIFYR